MVCKNCGMANSDMAKVCSECGSVLPAPPAKEPAAAQAQTPAAEPAVNHTAPPVPPTVPIPGIPYAAVPGYGYMPPAPPVQMPAYAPYGAYVPQPAQAMSPYAGNAIPAQMPVPPAPQAQTPPVATPPSAPVNPQVQPGIEPIAQQPIVNEHPFGEPLPTSGTYSAQPIMPPVQMPYAQMPLYQPPYGMPPLKDAHAAKANWSLALGIVAAVLPIVTCSLGSPLGLIAGVIALILSGLCLNKVGEKHKGKAIAGLILGIVGILISILSFSMLYNSLSTLVSSDDFQRFYEQYNSFIHMFVLGSMRVVMHTMKVVIGSLQQLMSIFFLR